MRSALKSQSVIGTLEEYEALPKDERMEVFDGVVYDMSSPSQIHQRILLKISSILDAYVERKKDGCLIIPAPFDVVLSKDPLTVVQPDIMIVCDKDKLDGSKCNGAPDFVIEIVSPGNPSDDYIKKTYFCGFVLKNYRDENPVHALLCGKVSQWR